MLLGPIQNAPLEEWETMLASTCTGSCTARTPPSPTCSRPPRTRPRQVADVVNISSVAGRVARLGSGVYNLTKHGVGAFSESLRQEVTQRHVRVSLVEPGAVATELSSHNRPEILDNIRQRFGRRRADGGGRHRGRDRVHRHAPATRRRQRAARQTDRAAGLGRDLAAGGWFSQVTPAGSASRYRARRHSTSSRARPPCRCAPSRAAAS